MLFVSALALTGGDGTLTMWGIAHGRASEANRVMALAADYPAAFGIVQVGTRAALALYLRHLAAAHPTVAKVGLVMINVAGGAAIAWNMRQLRLAPWQPAR